MATKQDLGNVRLDFPILNRKVNGHPLVYLDNAATSQKPESVIQALSDYYRQHNANIHRGVHTLGDESTLLYQAARQEVAEFINAKSEELIFVKNTTEAVNLTAFSWGQFNVGIDDEIVVTMLDHHSARLPWWRLSRDKNAKLITVPVNHELSLSIKDLVPYINSHTKVVVLTAISNVTGSILPLKEMINYIHRHSSAVVFVDGAQSIPHQSTDVVDLDADFLAFSAHKMLGPMGIGALFVKKSLLTSLSPFLVGGGMIDSVSPESVTWAEVPDFFDAGTPNVAGAVGFAAACRYLKKLSLKAISHHEQSLTEHGLKGLIELEKNGQVIVYGPKNASQRAGILTFNIPGIHAHDVAQILDRKFGIAVRSGHHCNQIILTRLGTNATVRASVYLYNTIEEIDLLLKGITKVKQVLEGKE